MRWIDEQLVKYGEIKKQLQIVKRGNLLLLLAGLTAELGMVVGFIWNPVVFAGSVAVLSITLPVVVILSLLSDNLRSQYVSLKKELRIDD